MQWTRLLSLLGFSTFMLVSLLKGVSGESSCGCFGTVTVNPWITMVFDLGIVACLVVFRPEKSGAALAPRLEWKKLRAVLLAWFFLAGLALFFMLSLKQQPHELLGEAYVGLDGKLKIMLEPERWIGKEFSLISRFAEPDGAEILMTGTWNVLLIHTDCEKCQEMMAELESRKAERVAIVVVPVQSNEKIPDTAFPTFVLDGQNAWFAETPCIVKLVEGICVAVGDQIP